MRTLKISSLFAGCGGTDVGVTGGFNYLGNRYSPLPTRLVYANDFDRGACDLFDINFHLKSDDSDIRKVRAEDVPQCDFLTAGFPCQSFSIVAQNPPRLGIKDDEKGTLFEEVCRFLICQKPAGFFCENVKGILSCCSTPHITAFLKKEKGYSLLVLRIYIHLRHIVPQSQQCSLPH